MTRGRFCHVEFEAQWRCQYAVGFGCQEDNSQFRYADLPTI